MAKSVFSKEKGLDFTKQPMFFGGLTSTTI